MASKALNRRTLLRGAGASMALPFLDAMRPAFAKGEPETPRRMVAIETNLGILPQNFFPEKSGRDYELTPYLEVLKEFRDDLTIFSGVSHSDVSGGHSAEITYLTAAPGPGKSSFKNTISLDQLAAQQMGHLTRFPSLPLTVIKSGNKSLSWTNDGVMIPAERDPAAVFKQLFVQGSKEEVERQIQELRIGRSILDSVGDRAKALQRNLGGEDRNRMDQYFTSVRDLERRLEASEAWQHKPKPKVDVDPPSGYTDTYHGGDWLAVETSRAMYDVIKLALETDSTRLITLLIRLDGLISKVPGVRNGFHNYSHHGNRPEALAALKKLETAQFQALANLLRGLRDVEEDGERLLDRTMLLYGSNLGNSNNHSTRNMPMMLAGGGFKHGQHLAFDRENNYPLANLYVSMLQQLGLGVDKFASATGTMAGLETA